MFSLRVNYETLGGPSPCNWIFHNRSHHHLVYLLYSARVFATHRQEASCLNPLLGTLLISPCPWCVVPADPSCMNCICPRSPRHSNLFRRLPLSDHFPPPVFLVPPSQALLSSAVAHALRSSDPAACFVALRWLLSRAHGAGLKAREA